VSSATADASSALDLVWDAAAQLMLARALGQQWSLSLILTAGYAYGPRFQADERTRASLGGVFGEAAFSLQRQL
jgi:predicted membrane protein